MAAVYSGRFLQAHASSAGGYTVPVGFVLVVRDVDCFYSGGAGSYAQLLGPAGGIFAFFPFPASIDGAYLSWRGRQVFYAGETFTFTASDPVDIMVSGYLLVTP